MRQNWLNFDKKRYRYLSRLKPLFLIVAGFFFFGGGGSIKLVMKSYLNYLS